MGQGVVWRRPTDGVGRVAAAANAQGLVAQRVAAAAGDDMSSDVRRELPRTALEKRSHCPGGEATQSWKATQWASRVMAAGRRRP